MDVVEQKTYVTCAIKHVQIMVLWDQISSKIALETSLSNDQIYSLHEFQILF